MKIEVTGHYQKKSNNTLVIKANPANDGGCPPIDYRGDGQKIAGMLVRDLPGVTLDMVMVTLLEAKCEGVPDGSVYYLFKAMIAELTKEG